MTTINCHTCQAEILTYEPGGPIPPYVIVAPEAPVPGGNHVVHVCPQQPVYVAQRRPHDVLDWTDEQERAAVNATLPNWALRTDDVIFCMSWYNPGMREGAAPSAPLTVQVRRAGVDLAFAAKGTDFDEVSVTATQAAAIAEQIGVEPWPGLEVDLDAEATYEDDTARDRQQQAGNAAKAAEVWVQAQAEAEADADAAEAHALDHPDEDQLQQVAVCARANADVLAGYATRAAAEAEALLA